MLTTPGFEGADQKAFGAAPGRGQAVCLMWYMAGPKIGHRSVVAKKIAKATGRKIRHLVV